MISLRKLLLSLLWLSIPSVLYAQTTNGFFVDSLGKRHECLIKDKDGEYTPQTFRYQDTQGNWVDAPQHIREFGFNDGRQFIRYDVDIDQVGGYGKLSGGIFPTGLSTIALDSVYLKKDPQLQKATLLLERSIRGQVSLYTYQNKDGIRYYYQIGTEVPQLLVTNTYLVYDTVSEGYRTAQNLRFRQQLWVDLHHPSIPENLAKSCTYTHSNLAKYIVTYNSAIGSQSIHGHSKTLQLHVQLRVGIQRAYMGISTPEKFIAKPFSMATSISPRIGTELELVLPFKHQRWSLLFEPTFQQYKASAKESEILYLTLPNRTVSVVFSTIELPIGIRHYLPIGKDHQLFANAQVAWDIPVKVLLTSDTNVFPKLESSKSFYFLGLGYRYKQRYSLEVRYSPNRHIFDIPAWKGDYPVTAVMMGLRLF